MTTNLSRYHARAPRFVLSALEDQLVRLSGPTQIPWEESTRLHHISLVGLSFTSPSELCPIVGEAIKVLSDSPDLACIAFVTKIETLESEMLVHVQFQKMDNKKRLQIVKRVSQKIKDDQIKKMHALPSHNSVSVWRLASFIFAFLFTYFFIFRFL